MKKVSSVTIFIFLTISLGCGQQKQKKDIIAQVGQDALSLTELSDEIPYQIQSSLKESDIKEYIIRWINKEVLYQEAIRLGLDERPDFQQELENLKRELLINKLLEVTIDSKPATVTDEEIQNFYDQNGEEFVLNDEVVHCYHILCSSRQEAEAIRERLTLGAPFDQIIAVMNPDSLRFKNWDLGYFTKDQILPEIAKIVFSLPVGSYTNPIKSDFGYHVLKVVDKKTKGQKKDLSEVNKEIRLKLTELQRQENYERYLLQAKSRYQIQSNFQLLDSITSDSLANKGE